MSEPPGTMALSEICPTGPAGHPLENITESYNTGEPSSLVFLENRLWWHHWVCSQRRQVWCLQRRWQDLSCGEGWLQPLPGDRWAPGPGLWWLRDHWHMLYIFFVAPVLMGAWHFVCHTKLLSLFELSNHRLLCPETGVVWWSLSQRASACDCQWDTVCDGREWGRIGRQITSRVTTQSLDESQTKSDAISTKSDAIRGMWTE